MKVLILKKLLKRVTQILKEKGKLKIKTLSGTFVYNPSTTPSWCVCDASSLQGPLFVGSGAISHLGNTSTEVTSCVVPNQDFSILHVASSCVTMVTANGDEVILDQKPYDLIFNPSNGNYEGISLAKIVGGTGKYKHAKGMINAMVSQNPSNQVTSILSGIIKY